jgi:hypothetical protein
MLLATVDIVAGLIVSLVFLESLKRQAPAITIVSLGITVSALFTSAYAIWLVRS